LQAALRELLDIWEAELSRYGLETEYSMDKGSFLMNLFPAYKHFENKPLNIIPNLTNAV